MAHAAKLREAKAPPSLPAAPRTPGGPAERDVPGPDLERLILAAGASPARSRVLWPAAMALAGRFEGAVCIPACNEASTLDACLSALAAQAELAAGRVAVILLINNTDDRSFEIVEQAAARRGLPIAALQVAFPPERAHAGQARRLALDLGLLLTGPGGSLLTTDADSTPAPDWLAVNLELLARGYDAVCGLVQPDPHETAALPSVIHRQGMLEWRYRRASLALDAALDPDPCNPWPHHGQASGASLAVSASAYVAIGGLPTLPVGEDRAFVRELGLHGMKVRYSSDAVVVTSCRLEGRAPGGMADALAARIRDPDAFCDDRLELAAVTWRRALARGLLRRAGGPRMVRAALSGLALSPRDRRAIAEARSFGEAWRLVEALSPALARRRIRPSEIRTELPLLIRWLESLRRQAAAAHRCDILADVSP